MCVVVYSEAWLCTCFILIEEEAVAKDNETIFGKVISFFRKPRDTNKATGTKPTRYPKRLGIIGEKHKHEKIRPMRVEFNHTTLTDNGDGTYVDSGGVHYQNHFLFGDLTFESSELESKK
jgi:hypothetical protein